MPKRIIDGEGLWGSDKLARVEPEWVRPEYANLIPLALSNGVFECSVRRVWRDVYGYNRPSMTEKRVAVILDALETVKLLFRFESDGKVWGYWVGIDRPGRLPAVERRGIHERKGPEPPGELLQCFLMDTIGNHAVTSGNLTCAAAPAAVRPTPNPTPNPKPIPVGSELSLPSWVPVREWYDFVAMRLNIRKPIKTENQAQYCLRELDKLRQQGHDPAEVLGQSIAANWQGLFPPKNQNGAKNANTTSLEANLRNAKRASEILERSQTAGAGGAV